MKLTIKNKVFTFGGSSFVLDENGDKIFKVKGKIFSPTKKKKIYDMDGNLRYIVRNKYWKLFKTSAFIFDPEKNLVATLSNGDFDFKNKFTLIGGADDIVLSGKFFQFPNIDLGVEKNGKLIGTFTKNFSFIRDVYTIDVVDDEEADFMVALCIAIDNIWDRRRNSN